MLISSEVTFRKKKSGALKPSIKNSSPYLKPKQNSKHYQTTIGVITM